jgi:hypothetical protein
MKILNQNEISKKEFHYYIILFFCCVFLDINSQNWTWIKGSVNNNIPAHCGTLGITNSNNTPGGRGYASSCYDSISSNLWLFGGWHGSVIPGGYRQDLWKYNSLINQWTWMKGSVGSNSPGIYGVQGVPSVSNNPSARISALMWIDYQGNVWLFGGYGNSSNGFGSLSDLWKFDVITNEWTWIKGDSTINSMGSYGAKGIPNSSNSPSSRHGSVAFKDPAGNLCLFGGMNQLPSSSNVLNDLWRYNLLTNEWTWISGSSNANVYGIYGTIGVPTSFNSPGSRSHHSSWQDQTGNIWIFGGSGLSANGFGSLNDLWSYDWSSGNWTWIKGNNILVDQPGIYGTRAIPDTSNLPGSRMAASSWKDNNGNFWLFGGFGYTGGSPVTAGLADLWKYEIVTNSFTWIKGTNTWNYGLSGIQGIQSSSNNPSSREAAQAWTEKNGEVFLFGGQGIAHLPLNIGIGYLSDIWKLPPCLTSEFSISASSDSICVGMSSVLVVSGSLSFTWSTGQTYNSINVTPQSTTTYTVYGTDSKGCTNSVTYTQIVLPCTSIEEKESQKKSVNIYPNPSDGMFVLDFYHFQSGTTFVILNSIGQEIYRENLVSPSTHFNLKLQKGIYQFITIGSDNKICGKLIID